MEDKYNQTVTDPVCGMKVTPATAQATAEYGGRTYYFCSVSCKENFVSDPERYVTQDEHGHR
jgi:Cu+-exporting ATPase